MKLGSAAVMCVVALFTAVGIASPQGGLRAPDVGPVPTPPEVVTAMLKLAGVTANDVVYDLGSGDGRVPIAAAKEFGARAVGIDLDPKQVETATAKAKEAGVSDRVRFLNQDLFTAKIAEATVVTLYLHPALNLKLLPKLNAELRPGTRVVSHSFDMGDDPKPRRILTVGGRTVYLFVTPIR